MTRGAAAASAVLLLTGGLVLLFAGLRQGASRGVRRLRAVLDDPHASPGGDTAALSALWSQLTRSAERAGKGTNLFSAVARRLDRAGWALRPGELVVLVVGGAVVAATAGALLAGLAAGVLFGFAAVLAPVGLLHRTGQQLQRRVDAQLPDVLHQLAASMRAGLSLTQGIEAVADEGSDPLASQFARALAETRVGASLEEALGGVADRVGSVDLQWAVRAMVIQQQTGGKLSDILEVLAEFMREREEVRREVRSLTAEGRFSALVLLALPFFVGTLILAIRPDYLLPLFGDVRGLVMVGVAGVLMAIATTSIRKIVRIEV